MVLHPLKSELNWPIGPREPLDLTRVSAIDPDAPSVDGLRWKLPAVMLNILVQLSRRVGSTGGGTHVSEGETKTQSKTESTNLDIKMGDHIGINAGQIPLHFMPASIPTTLEGRVTVEKLASALRNGIRQHHFQNTPHLVLLSRKFYNLHLLEPITQWVTMWLFSVTSLPTADATRNSTKPLFITFLRASVNSPEWKSARKSIDELHLGDESVKLVNLAREWVQNLLPHVMGKVNRVTFGILSEAEAMHM